MSINSNMFLEHLKQGFARITSWNKYRRKIRRESKKNNLDCVIDPTLKNINRLFVLSFKNSDNDTTRNSFDAHYVPLVEI